MSHIRLFEHPADRGKFNVLPVLAISGSLAAARPELAYEGRLAIANLGQATAEVIAVTGALPPGATVTVDNAADQVVVAWPAYQASAAPIPNADFEQGDAQWLKGPGWSVVQNDVNDDPNTPTSQWAAKFANQGGNVELRNAVRMAVTAGQPISASCRVQQGASSAGNAGAAVRLFFQPATGVEVMREGNLVDSGSNSAWGTSALNTTAPVTGTVQIGCRGKRHRQNKPLWVDNFAWNVTQPSVGINVETTLGPITLRIRDTLGREAEWTGSILVQGVLYWSESDRTNTANERVTLSNGNRDAERWGSIASAATYVGARGETKRNSGRYYFEIEVVRVGDGGFFGLLKDDASLIAAAGSEIAAASVGPGTAYAVSGNSSAQPTAIVSGSVIGVGYDATTRKVWFTINGVELNNGIGGVLSDWSDPSGTMGKTLPVGAYAPWARMPVGANLTEATGPLARLRLAAEDLQYLNSAPGPYAPFLPWAE